MQESRFRMDAGGETSGWNWVLDLFCNAGSIRDRTEPWLASLNDSGIDCKGLGAGEIASR